MVWRNIDNSKFLGVNEVINMKNKLRRITINNETYYYRFTYKYQREPEYGLTCISHFKAYTEKNKNTPLVITIETEADYIIGNTLNVGTKGINLNLPQWARKLILLGLDRGWNGYMKMELQCDYELLEQIKGS